MANHIKKHSANIATASVWKVQLLFALCCKWVYVWGDLVMTLTMKAHIWLTSSKGTHLNISWDLIYSISLRFTIIFEKLAPGYTTFSCLFCPKAKERKRSLSDSPSRSSTIKEPSHWKQMTLLLAHTTALEKETGLNDLLDASAISFKTNFWNCLHIHMIQHCGLYLQNMNYVTALEWNCWVYVVTVVFWSLSYISVW